MELSLSVNGLAGLMSRQVENLVPDGQTPKQERFKHSISISIERLETCWSPISAKGYRSESGELSLNHLHSGQYASLLYLTASTAWAEFGDADLATRLYLLNKQLNALDLFYEVELPDVFFWEHPVGTVLGRAHYGTMFSVYQRCTVGGNLKLEYPKLGERVSMFAGSTVIGRSSIGNDVILAAGSQVVDEDVPAGSAVFGASPNLTVKPRRVPFTSHVFGIAGSGF